MADDAMFWRNVPNQAPGSSTDWQQQNQQQVEVQRQALENQRQQLEMERQRNAALAAQGLNPDGSPMALKWEGITNANGDLQDKYRLSINALDPTQWQGYSKYKQEALRSGPSAWAELQLQQQQQQAMQDKSAAAQQAMAGNSQAMSGLAMRGGLSGGARAALAMQGQRDLLNARQKVGAAANTNRLTTMSKDEENRVQQLGNLASSESTLGQFNKTLEAKQADANIQNLLGEVQGKRAFQQNTYNEQMRAWAANKQAEATRNSGGGGK